MGLVGAPFFGIVCEPMDIGFTTLWANNGCLFIWAFVFGFYSHYFV